MKLLWCWRCRMEVPMLDEEEYAVAGKLFSEGMKISNGKTDRQSRFQSLLDYYKKITGWDETEPNAIMHHRIAQYGPPCENCGKPYRTPQASFCAACGHKRDKPEQVTSAKEKNNVPITVYFISGLGIDERVFKKIELPPEIKVVHIKWPSHSDSDTLLSYCKKIAELIDTTEPFSLVGFSFGGIVCIELAKFLKPVNITVISSVTLDKELPFYLKLVGLIKVYRLVPTKKMNEVSSVTNWFNNIKNEADKKTINEILKDTNPYFIKWAIDKILNWKNSRRPNNLYHIHGKDDRLFPCSKVHADKIINGGGHFMVLTHAKEINNILNERYTLCQK